MDSYHHYGLHSERELRGGACTPPRDDLAGAPRFVETPRSNRAWEDAEDEAVTWQACSMSSKMVFFTLLVFGSVVWMYRAEDAIFPKAFHHDCKEEQIDNGVVLAGERNESAVVRCNEGYAVANSSVVDVLKCSVYREWCMHFEPTSISGTETTCINQYAFIPAMSWKKKVVDDPGHHRRLLVDDPGHFRRLLAMWKANRPEKPQIEPGSAELASEAVRNATMGVCQWNLVRSVQPSRLVGGLRGPLQLAPARAALQRQLPLVALAVLVFATLSTMASSRGRRLQPGLVDCAGDYE